MAEPDSTPESEAALAQAREWGIHTIPVPTPFAVGRINCYLVECDPLTLIDAGPRSEKSWQGLEAGINADPAAGAAMVVAAGSSVRSTARRDTSNASRSAKSPGPRLTNGKRSSRLNSNPSRTSGTWTFSRS